MKISAKRENVREKKFKMSTSKEESIRVVSFDGKRNSWPSWKEKFLAKAKKKGYKDILLGKIELVSETTKIADDDAQREVKLLGRKLNEDAYADLVLSIDCGKTQGRVVFNLIKNSKNDDYPDGNARESWKSLERKFNPTTSTSRTKLHKEFYRAELRKGADPINFITYMEDLRERLKETKQPMSDEHFVTQILNGLTIIYDNEVRLIECDIDEGKHISIDDVKERLSLIYERKTGRQYTKESDDNHDADEKAFIAGQFKGKQFKGK